MSSFNYSEVKPYSIIYLLFFTFRQINKVLIFISAYGTYKLAKKMSKGLRRQYDDDECWEYSYFRDQYDCNCPNQCDIYVGAASAISVTFIFILGVSIINVMIPYLLNAMSLQRCIKHIYALQ